MLKPYLVSLQVSYTFTLQIDDLVSDVTPVASWSGPGTGRLWDHSKRPDLEGQAAHRSPRDDQL